MVKYQNLKGKDEKSENDDISLLKLTKELDVFSE